MRVKVAAMKVGIGHDGASRHFIEGDVLGREVGRTGYHHGMTHALWVLQGPAQGLHAAQAAAQNGSELGDAQTVEQQGLGVHPVFNRDDRKIRAIHLACVGVDVHRARRAKA